MLILQWPQGTWTKKNKTKKVFTNTFLCPYRLKEQDRQIKPASIEKAVGGKIRVCIQSFSSKAVIRVS